MDHRGETGRRGCADGERAGQVVAQRAARDVAQRADRVGGRGRIGRIRLDQEFGLGAAHEVAAEIRRDLDDEGDFVFGQKPARRIWIVGRRDDIEIAGVAQRRDDGVGEGAGIRDRDRGRQVLGVVVDREAEQKKLHQRHAEDECEGQPVAAELDRLLDEHGRDAAEREARTHA